MSQSALGTPVLGPAPITSHGRVRRPNRPPYAIPRTAMGGSDPSYDCRPCRPECHVRRFSLRSRRSVCGFSKRLPPIELPLSVDGWRNHFNTHFRNAHRVEEAYDVARNCQLVFSAGELGALTFGFSREFTPLRWSSRRHAQRFVVRLLNDSGYDSDPTVTRLAFETPIVEEPVDIAPEYPAPPSGGMYVARSSASHFRNNRSSGKRFKLDALSCNPRIASAYAVQWIL